ncbi:cyclase [Pedobacter steynii]|uniref:imidazole glycerol-phosphate synthase n=1 Tax=Pedobacter steynii TaxID=430522 RepID=A0A1G9WIQ9_9SPHI|nr:AglZ/HisF2 family acetamidino modification protein [Pedobacter steynii]NQX40309.1 imidazole glycerol phosphate synthase subunit HisF [Pedobacter steynii]SDM84349.1 cyclase [Pedobacter steynii]
MLRPRIIPCLLVKDKGLVKTVHFKNPKYVGDPINAVRIFNEKQVDELTVLDIDASAENREPDYRMIENLAAECRMPLCYGGGVKTPEQAQRIFSLGVEKIAISSAAVEDPTLVSRIAERVGSQSVVVIIDVKKKLLGGYEVYINNGKKATGKNPFDLVKQLEKLGAGEIVINSIDQDGAMKGYDLNLADKIRAVTHLPLTILGGAGSLEDIGKLISKFGIIGASAGSLFVFKGIYKAVLINYPNPSDKDTLIKNSFQFS